MRRIHVDTDLSKHQPNVYLLGAIVDSTQILKFKPGNLAPAGGGACRGRGLPVVAGAVSCATKEAPGGRLGGGGPRTTFS